MNLSNEALFQLLLQRVPEVYGTLIAMFLPDSDLMNLCGPCYKEYLPSEDLRRFGGTIPADILLPNDQPPIRLFNFSIWVDSTIKATIWHLFEYAMQGALLHLHSLRWKVRVVETTPAMIELMLTVYMPYPARPAHGGTESESELVREVIHKMERPFSISPLENPFAMAQTRFFVFVVQGETAQKQAILLASRVGQGFEIRKLMGREIGPSKVMWCGMVTARQDPPSPQLGEFWGGHWHPHH